MPAVISARVNETGVSFLLRIFFMNDELEL